MKAEPRNQKKTSVAPTEPTGLWSFVQRHGNKVLIGLILILLVISLVRYRRAETARRSDAAQVALSSAEAAIHYLGHSPELVMYGGTPEKVAEIRDSKTAEAQRSLDDAMTNADDDALKARIEIDRGDLNWQLANFPKLPGATTQPEKLGTKKTTDEYLSAAQTAYEQVLKEPLSRNKQAVTSARFGLAYIAENRSQWDVAAKRYQEVIDDPNTSKAFNDYAKGRLAMLAMLKKPVLLASGSPSTAPSPYIVAEAPTTLPTTLPSDIFGHHLPGATTESTTGPTVIPMPPTPSTAPATAPTTDPALPH